MTIRRWSFLLALVAVVASADQGPPVYQSVTTAPLAGTVCDGNRVQVETATGTIWTCVASVWTKTYDPQARILLQQPNEAFPYALNVSGLGEGLLLNEPYYGIVGVKLANTCTNQFPRYDNTSGVWTCQSIATSDLPGVPVSKGGTGIYTTTAGAVMSGAATNTMVWSAAGTNTLQVLHSGIAGVPTWGYVNVNSIETSNVASAGNFLRGDGSWAAATGSGAPTDATYIVQTPNAGLSAEQATNALASGIVRVTTGTGVLSSTTTVGVNEITGLTLDAIGNPGGDKSFTMATKHLQFTWTAPVTGTYDGAMELEATGNFGGDLLHVHQHTGNPLAAGHLIHAETNHANVVPLLLTASSAAANAMDATGIVNASRFVGPVTGTVTGNVLGTASYTNALATAGTTVTVLHGNASGNPAYAAVNLLADTTADLLSQAKGGTGGGSVTCAADQYLTSNGTTWSCANNQIVVTMVTSQWTSSSTGNTIGIVGTGGTAMTSPTYAANAPWGMRCQILDTRPGTSNQPRYGIRTSGSFTQVIGSTVVGLAGTAPARTETLNRLTAVAADTCATGCSAYAVTGGFSGVLLDTIEANGKMNAQGTVSLGMAPSASATHTIELGSHCEWFRP